MKPKKKCSFRLFVQNMLLIVFVSSCGMQDSKTLTVLSTDTPIRSATTNPVITHAVLPGADQATPAKSFPPIYISTVTQDSQYAWYLAQIWKIGRPEDSLLYEQKSISITDPQVPENIQQDVRAYLNQGSIQKDFSAIQLDILLDGLTLSPDRNYLIWFESFNWCPNFSDPPCFGFQRARIFNLTTRKIEWTLPTRNVLSDTSRWSPKALLLAYATQEKKEDGEIINEVQLIKLSKGEVSSLGQGDLPVWSPDGRKLAFVYEAGYGIANLRVKIISIDPPGSEMIINDSWPGGLFGLSWGPTDEIITLIASPDPMFDIQARQLYTLNPLSSKVSLFSTAASPGFLQNLQWSSDGTLLAFDARKTYGDNVSKLMVLTATGEVLNEFDVPTYDNRKWLWSPTEPKILRLLHSRPPRTNDLQILDPITSSITPVELPSAVVGGINNLSVSISGATW